MRYAISYFRSTVFLKFVVDYVIEPRKPDCRSPDWNRGEQ